MEDKDLKKTLITHVSRMRVHLDGLVQRGNNVEPIKQGCLACLIGRPRVWFDIPPKNPVTIPPSVVATADLMALIAIIDDFLRDLNS